MRLHDLLDRYLVQLEADGRSVHTRRQYERHVRLLGAWLGDREVTHEALAGFLISDAARLRPDGMPKKATAMNALRSSLRTFFQWAHAAGCLPTNPARLIRRARTAVPPPRGLSPDEQARLRAVLAEAVGEEAERDQVLFQLMLATGLRIGSALGLDVEDVDLAGGEIEVRAMKGGGGQVVFFGEPLGSLLEGLIGDRVEGALFESRHRRRLSARQVARRLDLWLERAGCRRASPHALRHSFGMGLYARCGDVLVVQAALGHRSIVSTTIYARPGPERVRRAVVGV
jgi:site-specific recombinase XerD